MAEKLNLHTQDEGPKTLGKNATRTYQPRLLRLATNENGVSMLEYALLASLIAVVAISSVTYLGERTKRTFDRTGEEIHDVLACAGVGNGQCGEQTPLPPGP